MKCIEFLGMPRAGKTTQIRLLKEFLEQRGFVVVVITDRERAEYVHVRPIESLEYLSAFFGLALDEYDKHLSNCDYLLIDCGFNDAAVWADVRLAMNAISQEECDTFKLLFSKPATFVDTSLYFDIPVDVALHRHIASGEHQAVDEVAMNKGWLEIIRASYAKNQSKFHHLVRIDGSHPIEVIEAKIHRILGFV